MQHGNTWTKISWLGQINWLKFTFFYLLLAGQKYWKFNVSDILIPKENRPPSKRWYHMNFMVPCTFRICYDRSKYQLQIPSFWIVLALSIVRNSIWKYYIAWETLTRPGQYGTRPKLNIEITNIQYKQWQNVFVAKD